MNWKKHGKESCWNVLVSQDNALAPKTWNVLKNLGLNAQTIQPAHQFLLLLSIPFPNLKECLKVEMFKWFRDDSKNRAVLQIFFVVVGRVKSTWETMCQVCWTLGGTYETTCKSYGSEIPSYVTQGLLINFYNLISCSMFVLKAMVIAWHAVFHWRSYTDSC